MPAAIEKRKRDDLFRKIFNTYLQWPELERRVFSLAHYKGQSPESISRTLLVDAEEVDSILRNCDLRLHDSLRDFLKESCAKSSFTPDGTASPTSCGQDLEQANSFPSRAFDIPHSHRIPA